MKSANKAIADDFAKNPVSLTQHNGYTRIVIILTLYGVAIDAHKPWAASLGNHDGLFTTYFIASRQPHNT